MNRALLVAFVCLLFLPLAVSAQNRNNSPNNRNNSPNNKNSSPNNRNSSATAKNSSATTNLIREDAERVANNIKNLTRFIYLLGNVTKDIETIDAAVQKRQASRSTIAQNQESKAKLSATFANWRVAMDELEKNFRTKGHLQKYYSKISGIGNLAGVAQDQAYLNQYNQSAQTFLQILNKLTDVLLEMP